MQARNLCPLGAWTQFVRAVLNRSLLEALRARLARRMPPLCKLSGIVSARPSLSPACAHAICQLNCTFLPVPADGIVSVIAIVSPFTFEAYVSLSAGQLNANDLTLLLLQLPN